MTSSTNGGEGQSLRRLRSRNVRWWGLWVGGPVLTVGSAYLAQALYWPDGFWQGGRLDPVFAVAAAIFTVIVASTVGIIYHRIIDEQEERAVLCATAVGFYLLAIGGGAWMVLALAGLVGINSFLYLLLGSLATTLAVQLWLQFR